MKPKLLVVDSIEDLKELETYLREFEYIAIDTETTGLTSRDQIIGLSVCAEETKSFYVITHKWDVETQQLNIAPCWMRIKEFVKTLEDKQLIAHNAVFDCMMIESNYDIKLIPYIHTDTLILAHLLDENRRVGLKELGIQYFGEDSTIEQKEMEASVIKNGGHLTKDSYELYKGDPHLIGKYGAKDTLLTLKLFYKLVSDLYEQGLDKFFYEEESMPLLRGPTYELNTTGLNVDSNKLSLLKTTLQAECLEAKDFIYQEINAHIKDKYPGTNKKNVFNIGASQQLSWLLFGVLGLEFGTLTKGGKTACKAMNLRLPYTKIAKRDFIAICQNRKDEIYEPEAIINGKKRKAKKIKDPWAYIACDKKTLKKLAPKYKWIEKLLEYQRKTKIINTYITGLQERIQYGVIHPSFLQHGTKGGRLSSKNPNFQNLPRDDQRIKECIVARPGKVFVSADYSQLEPRIFAFYSKDKKLMQAFDGTSDFYSVIGIDVYDKYDAAPQKDGSPDAFGIKYKTYRDDAKVIALASAYGATPNQLASTTGKSIEDTASDIQKYFERFPGVRTMMLEAHELVKKHGFVTNHFGRPRRIPEATRINKLYGNIDHWDLPYDARKLLNMACNHRIQSTGASLINRAAIRFYDDSRTSGIECSIVSQVHDELIVECLEADSDNIAMLLRNAMETTNELPGVSLEAIPRITKTLAKK